MAYNLTKLTKLSALQDLAKRAETAYAKKAELEELQSTVDGIIAEGGEPNVIEGITVNGTDAEVTNKVAAITIPTATSDLANDSDYQSGTDVATAIQTAISESGHASFEVVDNVPSSANAEANILYLVKNADTGYYDIYTLIGDDVVLLDDTSVDLTDYTTNEELKEVLASYATSEDVKEALGDKIDSDSIATDDEVTEMLNEIYGVTE